MDASKLDARTDTSLLDIGLLKLVTVANRASQKDVYDLDYLTEHIPLQKLMEALKSKQEKFNGEHHKKIFDLDNEVSIQKISWRYRAFLIIISPN